MKKEHSTLIGEVLDPSNGWSFGDRLLGAVLSPLIDPGVAIGRGLKKLGIDMPENDDNWHLTCD